MDVLNCPFENEQSLYFLLYYYRCVYEYRVGIRLLCACCFRRNIYYTANYREECKYNQLFFQRYKKKCQQLRWISSEMLF